MKGLPILAAVFILASNTQAKSSYAIQFIPTDALYESVLANFRFQLSACTSRQSLVWPVDVADARARRAIVMLRDDGNAKRLNEIERLSESGEWTTILLPEYPYTCTHDQEAERRNQLRAISEYVAELERRAALVGRTKYWSSSPSSRSSSPPPLANSPTIVRITLCPPPKPLTG